MVRALSNSLRWITVALAALLLGSCGASSKNDNPESLSITPAAPALAAGLTQQLQAIGHLHDGSPIDLSSGAVWTSSAPAVASVDASGKLHALSAGQAVITAVARSVAASTTVVVEPPAITGLAVSPKSLNTGIGGIRQLTAIATYTDGSQADVSASPIWTSDTVPVARVTAGLVSAQSAGTTNVRASAGGFSDTSAVSVVAGGLTPCTDSGFVHYNHTATLLNDGRVLVAGQTGDTTNPQSPPEIYDPVNDRWMGTGSMVDARRYQSPATRLASGKVLVTTGKDETRFPDLISTAEFYDPATDSWAAARDVLLARLYHTSTLLPNGKVLLAGGTDYGVAGFTGAEIYDPGSNQWAAGASMTQGRFFHSASLLGSGKVLVAGGIVSNTSPVQVATSAELYDPVVNTWSSGGNMAHAHAQHTATLLADGRVMIIGGDGTQLGSASVEIYNPVSNSWSSAASMTVSRASDHTASLLPSGKVLVVGGIIDQFSGNATASSELYDPVSNSWQPGPTMPVARSRHTATPLSNGALLIAGGKISGTSCALYW